MKKFVLISLFILPIVCYAQSVVTTTKYNVDIMSFGSIRHTFIIGDTVTIHAFKKKEGKYNYIIETKEYSDLISLEYNPFNVEEKNLKKLPDALSSESEELLKQLKDDVEKRKRAEFKKKALSGEVCAKINSFLGFKGINNALGEVQEGDEIHVLGYTFEERGFKAYKYALYNDNAVGVFESQVSNNSELLNKKIGADYLPSIDDVDVQRTLNEKYVQLIKKVKSLKLKYKNKAVKGEIKGCFAVTPSNLTNNDGQKKKKEINDIVSILGYSKRGNNSFYAIYSDKGVGVYKESLTPSSLFQNGNELNFNYLPSVDDPDVKILLDSIQNSINRRELKKLEGKKQNLIDAYRQCEPVIVQLNSLNSNSVGGIEVSLNVINCATQPIKYITIQGYFTNAVGDKCRNDIGGGFVWKGKGVGPIGPRPTSLENFDERYSLNEANYTFDDLKFYSRVAENFHFSSVSIEYMNGKKITLSGAILKKHIRY